MSESVWEQGGGASQHRWGDTGYGGVVVGITGVGSKDLHVKQRRQMKRASESMKFTSSRI